MEWRPFCRGPPSIKVKSFSPKAPAVQRIVAIFFNELLRAARLASADSHRLPYSVKTQSRFDTRVWHANTHFASFSCGRLSATVAGLNVSDGASYSNARHPHPPFIAGFVPPDYFIDGLIKRRFYWPITAPTKPTRPPINSFAFDQSRRAVNPTTSFA